MTTDARGEVVRLTMLEAEIERGLGGLKAMMDALRTTKQRRRDHRTASEFS